MPISTPFCARRNFFHNYLKYICMFKKFRCYIPVLENFASSNPDSFCGEKMNPDPNKRNAGPDHRFFSIYLRTNNVRLTSYYSILYQTKMGESNSPVFHHFYVGQFMQLSLCWPHSLFSSFINHFLAFHPALGMPLNRKRKQRSENKAENECVT